MKNAEFYDKINGDIDYSSVQLLGYANGQNSYLLYRDDGESTDIDMASNVIELK